MVASAVAALQNGVTVSSHTASLPRPGTTRPPLGVRPAAAAPPTRGVGPPLRAAGAPRSPILLVASDAATRAELVALAGEADVGVVVRTPEACRREWAGAPLVLADATAGVLEPLAGLPRREAVLLARSSATELGDDAWRRAVDLGVERVVVLPEERGWLLARLRRVAAGGRAVCLGVVGARGGAGATSAAVALSTVAATAGLDVLLVDGDPLGGGLDLAVGAEQLPGLRWADLDGVASPLPEGGLAAALPQVDGATLLSHDRRGGTVAPATAAAVVEAAVAEYRLVVVDLPRNPDPAARCLLSALDLLVVVCPAEVRASAAVPTVLAEAGATAPVRLLVRGPSPSGLSSAGVEEAVRATGVPLAAGPGERVRAEPGLSAALDRGESFAVGPRSPLRRWAVDVLVAEVPDFPVGRVKPRATAVGRPRDSRRSPGGEP